MRNLCLRAVAVVTCVATSFLNAAANGPDGCALVRSMDESITYQGRDFSGEAHQGPELGCELCDFGSWYDAAYNGGINRFWINSTRHHTYNQTGFNSAQDVGLFALFLRTGDGTVIDGSSGKTAVTWHAYGWTTTTCEGGLEIESTFFYTAFNTVAVVTHVRNAGVKTVAVTPGLLLTDRSEYDGLKGGLIAASQSGNRLLWRNRRIGTSSPSRNYVDSLCVGSDLGSLHGTFLPRYLSTARGGELSEALGAHADASLSAPAGAVLALSDGFDLAPGQTRTFAFFIGAGADDAAASKCAADAASDFAANGPEGVATRVERDWNDYLAALPRPDKVSLAELKLYYNAALGLRVNRLILKRASDGTAGEASDSGLPAAANLGAADAKAVYYSASCPSRGGFNLFFQILFIFRDSRQPSADFTIRVTPEPRMISIFKLFFLFGVFITKKVRVRIFCHYFQTILS